MIKQLHLLILLASVIVSNCASRSIYDINTIFKENLVGKTIESSFSVISKPKTIQSVVPMVGPIKIQIKNKNLLLKILNDYPEFDVAISPITTKRYKTIIPFIYKKEVTTLTTRLGKYK